MVRELISDAVILTRLLWLCLRIRVAGELAGAEQIYHAAGRIVAGNLNPRA